MYPRLITFEGCDGSGKTAQAERLAEGLRRSTGEEVVLVREPGSTEAGEQIRRLMEGGKVTAPYARFLAFLACRCELVHAVIKPAMERGAWIVADRYIDSTRVYQSEAVGHRLAHAEGIIETVEDAVREIRIPGLTIVMQTDADVCADRLRARGEEPDEADLRALGDAFTRLMTSSCWRVPRRWLAVYDHGYSSADTIAEAILAKAQRMVHECEYGYMAATTVHEALVDMASGEVAG